MGLADEGQHVVFAERVELDVLHQHDLTRVGREQRAVDDFVQVLRVTPAQVAHGLGRARRRIGQPFAGRIFP
ncbi:hypothetical protein D3C81_2122000 [compost metagenome]